jgi:hypothetical protein
MTVTIDITVDHNIHPPVKINLRKKTVVNAGDVALAPWA